MNSEEKNAKERIILATIELIEKKGINSITTRGIASTANVNSAAINYYFGSKEKLLDEALKHTLSSLKLDFDQFTGKASDHPGEMLQVLLYYFLAGSMRFPGITKAHLYGLFVNNDQSNPFIESFKEFLKTLGEKLGQMDDYSDKTKIGLSLTQMFSAVLLPCLFPDIFKDSMNLDLKDETMQKKYITNLVNHYYSTDKELGEWHPYPMG